MRGDETDRGSSALESGLIVAVITLIVLPLVFFLGLQVRGSLDQPCEVAGCSTPESGGGGAPAIGSGGTGAGGGGGAGGAPGDPGPGSGDPTLDLQYRVATIVAGTSAACDGQSTLAPPAGSTALCSVTFADGRIADYTVRWLDDVGTITVTPA